MHTGSQADEGGRVCRTFHSISIFAIVEYPKFLTSPLYLSSTAIQTPIFFALLSNVLSSQCGFELSEINYTTRIRKLSRRDLKPWCVMTSRSSFYFKIPNFKLTDLLAFVLPFKQLLFKLERSTFLIRPKTTMALNLFLSKLRSRALMT